MSTSYRDKHIIPLRRSPSPGILVHPPLPFTTAAGLAAASTDRAPFDTRQSIMVLSAGTILVRISLGSAVKCSPNAADRSASSLLDNAADE